MGEEEDGSFLDENRAMAAVAHVLEEESEQMSGCLNGSISPVNHNQLLSTRNLFPHSHAPSFQVVLQLDELLLHDCSNC